MKFLIIFLIGNIFGFQQALLARAGEEVTVQFFNPKGKQIQHDIKDRSHRFDDAKPGAYQFCFSNRHTNKKVITFEIVEIIKDVLELEEHNLELINLDALEQALVGSHDKINDSIEKLQRNNKNIYSVQFYLKGQSRRDQFLLDQNLKRVNFWSFVYLFALLATAAVQITFIKSFFANVATTSSRKIGL